MDTEQEQFVKTVNRPQFLRLIAKGMIADGKDAQQIYSYLYDVNSIAFVEPLADLEVLDVMQGLLPVDSENGYRVNFTAKGRQLIIN